MSPDFSTLAKFQKLTEVDKFSFSLRWSTLDNCRFLTGQQFVRVRPTLDRLRQFNNCRAFSTLDNVGKLTGVEKSTHFPQVRRISIIYERSQRILFLTLSKLSEFSEF